MSIKYKERHKYFAIFLYPSNIAQDLFEKILKSYAIFINKDALLFLKNGRRKNN